MKELTFKNEIYSQLRASGATQEKAYRTAYSVDEKTSRNVVDVKASMLEKQPHIKARINELRQAATEPLEAKRQELVELAIKIALGEEKSVSKDQVQILQKLLDKILPTMSQVRNENKDVTFEEFLRQLETEDEQENLLDK